MSTTCQPRQGPRRIPLAHQERIAWHHHTHPQLISPRRGVLHIATPMGGWVVPPHRAVWIPAHVAHAHQAYGPTDMRALTLDRPATPLRLDRPTVLAVTPLLREVIAALTGDERPTGAPRRNLERVAVDQLRLAPALDVCLPTPSDPRLRDLTRLLRDDPADGRTLAALGAAVGAGERTLSRLFRSQTGMSFPQWRTQLRLHHALKLLATGASVTEVATACGYSGPSAFIHAFRLAFGTTPGEYVRDAAPGGSAR